VWQREKLTLSAHLCGRWVRDLCLGKPSCFQELGDIWEMFSRLQMNFHAQSHRVNEEAFVAILKQHFSGKSVIFQMDGTNERIFHDLAERREIQVLPLFDQSGGAGVLPTKWFKKIGDYCGYAGGLSPENLEREMERISQVASGPIWVDTETRVRSEDDSLFVLERVSAFLKAATPWVELQDRRVEFFTEEIRDPGFSDDKARIEFYVLAKGMKSEIQGALLGVLDRYRPLVAKGIRAELELA